MAQTDFARLIIEADSRPVKNATKDLSKFDSQSGKTERSISSLSTGFRSLFIAAGGTYAISQLISGFNSLTDAGSDLYEAINKGSVVLGQSFNDVERFANTSSMRLGQTKQEAIDAASTFGIIGKSAGLAGNDLSDFSIQFTELASDFASFYNTSPQDAITAIGAAFRGEAEPIRRYGVLMDDATLKQIALKEGIINTTKGALTPQQKVLAASKLIMEQTTDAQGDFTRTSKGLANQQRINKALWEDIAAEIGNKFVPVANIATGITIELGKAIKDQINSLKEDKITKYRNEIDNLSKSYNTLTIAYGSFSVMSNTVKRTQEEIEERITNLNSKISELSNSYNQSTISYQNYVKAQKEEEKRLAEIAEKAALEKVKQFEKESKAAWEELSRVAKITSEHNRQRLEIVKKSNEAIQKENERQLNKAIEIDKRYQGFVEAADMAEINNIRDKVEREFALHKYKYDKIKEKHKLTLEEMAEVERAEAAERESILFENDYWAKYLNSLQNNIQNTDKIIGDTLNNMSAKFGQFFADAIWDSDNLGESFDKMAIGLGKSMTAAVGEMIAQWVVMAITKKAISAATTAASIAEAGAVAAAWAPAAAAVSLASFGANAAPAGAGIAGTYALASGLSLAGMAKDGIDKIPEDGTWLLHKGERVVNSETSKKLDGTLNDVQNYMGSGNVVATNSNSGNNQKIEYHYHYHSDGPTFLNRAQFKDAAKMFMVETKRELTRIGAVN